MSVAARMRTVVRRARSRTPSATDRWQAYLAGVEPALASAPRVHRFATPPLTAAEGLTAAPVAVWVEGTGEPAQRTLRSLQAGTCGPATILQGPLPEVLSTTRAPYVALVRAGDVLAPLALERLGQAATLAPDAHLFTCDDDRLDPLGTRHSPHFRPGPSPDRWLAQDDSGPLLVVAREAAVALAGELQGGAAWRHELALGLAGRSGDRHAHVPLLLCHRGHDVVDAPDFDRCPGPARSWPSRISRRGAGA